MFLGIFLNLYTIAKYIERENVKKNLKSFVQYVQFGFLPRRPNKVIVYMSTNVLTLKFVIILDIYKIQ